MNARFLVVSFAITVLAACGGGGTSAPDPTTVTITSHSPESIHFDANSSAFEIVYATIEGIDPTKLYFGAVASGGVVQSISAPDLAGDSQTVSVVVNGTISMYLAPGSYSGDVTFHVCTEPACRQGEVNGSPLTLPITYEVSGFSPALRRPWPSFEIGTLHFGIGSNPAASDRRRTFDVGANPSADWTATANVPWLTVDPASASGGPVTVTAALVDAEVANLGNGTQYGTVTFTRTSDQVSFDVPVELAIDRTFTVTESFANGSFAAGLQGWRVDQYGEVATVSTDGGALRVTPIAVGDANLGGVTLRPVIPVQIRAGHHYRLSFDASADAPRMIYAGVSVGSQGAGWDFRLTPTRQHYQLDFDYLEAGQGDLDLALGGSPAAVTIDDVSFHEVP